MYRYVFSLGVLFFVFGCQPKAEKMPAAVPEVVVEDVIIRDVPKYIHATGYTGANQQVQLPARVTGFLKEITYNTGEIVAAGTRLFLIEQAEYINAVNAAKAKLASAKAQHDLAVADLERTEEMRKKNAATDQDVQTDAAKRDVTAADILAAEAALDDAELNLSYTDIKAPFMGKTSENYTNVGNLVGPGTDHAILANINDLNPILVFFELSDSEFNQVNRSYSSPEREKIQKEQSAKLKEMIDAQAAGKSKPDRTTTLRELNILCEMGLLQSSSEVQKDEYPYVGTLNRFANTMNIDTGTILVEAGFPNEDYKILPGQICRVRVPQGTQKDAVLVKQEAIGIDLNQHFVYVIDDKNVAHRRGIEVGTMLPDGTRLVLKGLQKGERYVIDGLQKTRDGKEIKPVTKPAETEKK